MEPPPLTGLRVLEFAGLAPGPFAGMLLADSGASVIRIDRPARLSATIPPHPTPDLLTRRKTCIAVDLKDQAGVNLIKHLSKNVDIIIDPFRPGVLDRIGLGPDVLCAINPRLIFGRMTGFRRDGQYSQMAGHDINYLSVSGVLSMIGRANERPYSPLNLIGDFGGGGLMLVMGLLQALYNREKTGRGQVVEANMVDGSAYLASMPRLGTKTPMWNKERGFNILDGGCPYYDTYETQDGKYMAVGALEPQFFRQLIKCLNVDEKQLPENREDPKNWPKLREIFQQVFAKKTRFEWEEIFQDTDACCTPVLTQQELEQSGYHQRPAISLERTPAFAIIQSPEGDTRYEGQGQGFPGDGWTGEIIHPGKDGEAVLMQWTGWKRGKDFDIKSGALIKCPLGIL